MLPLNRICFLQGLIHVSELLAPSHLVAGDVEEEEGEQYTEVADIAPASYYKVNLAQHSTATNRSTMGCHGTPYVKFYAVLGVNLCRYTDSLTLVTFQLRHPAKQHQHGS